MTKNEKIEKIFELLPFAFGFPEMKYFDIDSFEMLDEKIEVLQSIKEGKHIKDIPNFYNILELMPKNGIWD